MIILGERQEWKLNLRMRSLSGFPSDKSTKKLKNWNRVVSFASESTSSLKISKLFHNLTLIFRAEKNKVGDARQEPNHSPFLPPPVGRLSLSLNPFKMLNQLVGPAVLRKFYCYCALACCAIVCLAMFPLVFSNLMSTLIAKGIFRA